MAISLIHRAANFSIKVGEKFLKLVLGKAYLKFVVELVNELDLVYDVPTATGSISFKCMSETTRIRAREMLRREPDTLEWIRGFSKSDVFWDIGANIGVFSLYAAKIAGAKVWAFDPLPQNFINLFENITINRLNHLVTPLCLAITDKSKLDSLHISYDGFTSGGAGCAFGIGQDNYGKDISPFVEHPSLGYSIDELISQFDLPIPNHLKVDIDGIQESVILGARKTLRNQKLISVMFELQPEKIKKAKEVNELILFELREAGFVCNKIAAATPNMTNDRKIWPTNNFFIRKT